MNQTRTALKPSASILPLPEDVVAQIKSSAVIVSLLDVVLELLKNSLDARATKVEASVDFARGACTVEDDGVGIPRLEFTQQGGLGRRYCTSKHAQSEPLLGRHGTFLASLSAVALVTITSRHSQHRSHNSVTFHHAKTVQTQLPAPSHLDVDGKHGTRVTVRNLFGNLPVRVKLRSKAVEHKAEHDRLWGQLKSRVAALVLSWTGSVSLRVRDADNRIRSAFNTSDSWPAPRRKDPVIAQPPSPHLTSMLAVLTQADYISVSQWPAWIPVSASTPSLSIKGAISLEPAPTRSIQFISLGIRPLAADGENNELYREVNRLFRHSSFGVEQEAAPPHQQSKVRKGVDRYPMFHLRISLRKDTPAYLAEDNFIAEETNLQAVVEVLGAMIVQWLKAHHFRPILTRPKRETTGASTRVPVLSSEQASLSTATRSRQPSATDLVRRMDSRTPSSNVVTTLARKRKQSVPSDRNVEKPTSRAFAKWSRIKSGKADYFNLPAMTRQTTSHLMNDLSLASLDTARQAGSDGQPLAQGTLSTSTPSRDGLVDDSNCTVSDNDKLDESLVWIDPSTKKAHLLNARTGCLMPLSRSKSATQTFESPLLISHAVPRKLLRLASKTAAVGHTPWLDGILQTWVNPVFRASEQRIEHMSPQDDTRHNLHHQCCSASKDALHNTQSLAMTRLSKDSLVSAEVLAQVDRKFILVKMKSRSNDYPDHDASRPLLVLIDQHAADERIRVETLLRELCSPIAAHCFGYQSKLGHRALVRSVMLETPLQFTVSRQERLHFTTYAGNFAAWGILFDFMDSAMDSEKQHTSEDALRLYVAALPPSISERCQADAQLLISFLRSAVWGYANDASSSPHPSAIQHGQPLDWMGRLGHCPEGLIDIINSRACRSAIMFNDELDMDQARGLVQNLARCAFPFVCAHGRPSMAPLGDVGGFADHTQATSSCLHAGQGSFVQAWKQWAH